MTAEISFNMYVVQRTQVEYRLGSWSEIIEHSQSETFPPLSPGQSQPIRGFPGIEPRTFSCHHSKVI